MGSTPGIHCFRTSASNLGQANVLIEAGTEVQRGRAAQFMVKVQRVARQSSGRLLMLEEKKSGFPFHSCALHTLLAASTQHHCGLGAPGVRESSKSLLDRRLTEKWQLETHDQVSEDQ